MDKLFKIKKNDNVGIALKAITENEIVKSAGTNIKIKTNISPGHKIALKDIKKGEKIIKYNYPIGTAIENINRGDWVHTHNLKTDLKGKLKYKYNPEKLDKKISKNNEEDIPHFKGYKRENGEIGIRNEIWVLPTVGCVNKNIEKMVNDARLKYINEMKNQNFDGIFAYTHPLGCSQGSEDLKNTQKILSNLIKHPNAGGVLVVGLGCENNQIKDFKKYLGNYNENRVKFINLQYIKNGNKTGINKIGNLINYARNFIPENFPVSRLKVGLKCGGSDGFSGITANPLLGKFSDKLVSLGGTTILTEVPEMFGAEEILMNRAHNKKVFNKIVDLINNFKDYLLAHGENLYENPSKGNIEGGITTLEEKSLGNIEKGGCSPVCGVSSYGEKITNSGLQLLSGPGNDLVSTTNLTAAGAQLILFTTGRGTPFGAPVPTVKISTNSDLFNKKNNWIDFNSGQLLENNNMKELSKMFFEKILKIASCEEKAKNEINGCKEITIFKKGVTL
ncbi:MAG: UxaA family hydrolase [Bacillota bacterium]